MHYYIDGYNLIFRLLGNPNPLQKNRDRAIVSINEIIAKLNLNVTIVFDAAGQKNPEDNRHHFDVLEIVYTKKNSSADEYILHAIQYSERPSLETVVTSDLELARRCKSYGAKIQSIEDFVNWIEKKQKKMKTKKMASEKTDFQESDAHFNRLLEIFEKRLFSKIEKKKK